MVVWKCQDMGDWESLATIYHQGEQWPQVLSSPEILSLTFSFLDLQALQCSLRALAEYGPSESNRKENILHVFHIYQE